MATRQTAFAVLITAVVALVASVLWTVTQAGSTNGPRAKQGLGMMGAGIKGDGEPVRTIDDAKKKAAGFAESLDLQVGEVIQFKRNYYAVLQDSSGKKATEVLVDPDTGATWLEYGPAMMWNTRYGMMGDGHMGGSSDMMGNGNMGGMMGQNGKNGMMGSGNMGGRGGMQGWYKSPGRRASNQPIEAEEAERIANRWLAKNRTGLTVDEAEKFPGYYTLETLRDGKVAGMMSVNAKTGAVWYHSWHGRFISMSE